MRKAIAASLLIAGASIAMPVLGHADDTVVTVPTSAAGMNDTYLVATDGGSVQVWEETNGLANLQTKPTPVLNPDGSPKLDENGNPIFIPADKQDA